jgi:hypothetical protein
MAANEEVILRLVREELLKNALRGTTPQVDAQGLLTDPQQLRQVTHVLLEVILSYLDDPALRPVLEGVLILTMRATHDLVCSGEEEEKTEEQRAWQPSSPFSPLRP